MNLIERLHGRWVMARAARLSELLAPLLPGGSSVLDVGCGDGLISSLIAQVRPDLHFKGVEVLVRDQCYIPLSKYDGRNLPCGDRSYGTVMFVDVLHHTEDTILLLNEAARVASRAILIKDHLREGIFSDVLLRFMDRVGNARFGVALTYNYWPRQKWFEAFSGLTLKTSVWKEALRIYPWPASFVFDRSLHFIARLDRANEAGGD